MHAAFFKILNEKFLEPAKNLQRVAESWQVRCDDKFFWRVTGLNAEILRAAMSVFVGEKIQVGALILCVEEIICEKNVRADSDTISISDFISGVKNLSHIKEISFDFVSPVSFRIDQFDAPYPRAELIFSSLADKWTQVLMPAVVDKKIIRELAAQIRLTEWSGHSRKFYFARDRGMLAFWGKFSYDVEALDDNSRNFFYCLLSSESLQVLND